MRRYKHELQRYLKYKKHVYLIELHVVELRNKLCRQACKYGNVNKVTRELYLKYNRYLHLLNP